MPPSKERRFLGGMGMRASQKQWLAKFLVGTSALSLMGMVQVAVAQEAPAEDVANGDEIIVTGIRASLAASADIKREAQGVVDAISAEDIGKFPDTNLCLLYTSRCV